MKFSNFNSKYNAIKCTAKKYVKVNYTAFRKTALRYNFRIVLRSWLCLVLRCVVHIIKSSGVKFTAKKYFKFKCPAVRKTVVTHNYRKF